jgi:nucleoside phosphorylase
MKKVIVLVPTVREAEFFADHRHFQMHICGVGMAECAAKTAELIAESVATHGSKPDIMILAGIAGSYSDDLAIGDTVVVESETIADLGRFSNAGPDPKETKSDTQATLRGNFAPLFQKTYRATQLPEREGLPGVASNTVNAAGGMGVASTAAQIENMEGAAFFAVCERFGVPAAEIRTISNRVGSPVTADNLRLAAHSLAARLEEEFGE